MKLSENTKAGLFKTLATKSTYEAGIEFGLDKHYKTPASIKTAVYTIYRDILVNYEDYGLSKDTVDLVQKAVSERRVANVPKVTLAEKNEDLSIKDLIVKNRNISAKLIGRKLSEMDRSKTALRAESLVSLGKLFGILFDKGQIIMGQATEHVAVMSNIDSNLSPADALALVLKMRETNIESQNN